MDNTIVARQEGNGQAILVTDQAYYSYLKGKEYIKKFSKFLNEIYFIDVCW